MASKSFLPMSGAVVNCVKEMVTRLMIGTSICNFNNITKDITKVDRDSSTLFSFQRNMRDFVSLILIYM